MLRKKSFVYLLLMSLFIAFNITLFSNSFNFDSNGMNRPDTTIEIFDLRVSGPQINITTPENITYTSPMSGYYPGTYSFDDAIIGQTAPGWIDGFLGCYWIFLGPEL